MNPSTVYWIGSDNNVYAKGAGFTGVQNIGAAGPQVNNGIQVTHQNGATTILPKSGFIADPNTSGPGLTNTGGASGSGSGSGTGTIDPAVAALLGGQIGNVNTQIGGLDGQLSTDLQNIASQFNQSQNREGQSFQNATDQYNTQKGNTISDLMSAKGNIATNVRQSTQALQTLLSLAGSGTSSASEIAAPFAASQAGAQQQQGVQTTYGRNLQGLDTAYNTTKQQHDNNLTDLGNQKFQANQKAEGDINSTRQNLLSTLAGLTSQQADAQGLSVGQAQARTAPFLSQIQALIGQQGQYNKAYPNVISLANPSSYTAPTLGSYNAGSIGAPGAMPSTAQTAPNAPLITTLAQKDKLPAVG